MENNTKNKRIRKLRARVKSYLDYSDAQILKWWTTKNPAFDNKKPSELAKTNAGLKKMEMIIGFSDVPLAPEDSQLSLPIGKVFEPLDK